MKNTLLDRLKKKKYFLDIYCMIIDEPIVVIIIIWNETVGG